MKVTESAMSAIKALDCTPASLSTSGSMVIEAVESLGGGGRGGLSLQSIKKYHVVVDQNKQDALTRKAVKKLVDEGKLIQVKGTGASGSFKLAAAAKKKPTVVARNKPAKKAVLKIKITAGRTPVKSSRKSLSRKTEASKKEKRPKADTEKKLKKTIPKKSTDLKGSSKTTSKPAAKKQSSKKK